MRAARYPRAHARAYRTRILAHAGVAAILMLVTLVGQRTGGGAASGPAPALRVSALSLPGLAAAAPAASVTRLDARAVPLTVVAPAVQQEIVIRATDTTQQALSVLGQRVASASASPAAATAPTGNERVVASRTEERLRFYEYVVQEGDTVSGIAARFGIGTAYIAWNNVHVISDQDALTVGSRLQIPAVDGILHQVRVGETLTGIAAQYDAKVADITGFSANGLAGNPNLLREGSTILVPAGKIAPRPALSLRPAPAAQAAAPAPAASAPGRARFIWPVVNNVTSFFGPSHPLGIDIEAPYVPVAAAAAGQVVFAGGDRCCSYGYNVVLRHEGGLETRYAHLSSIAVALGQFVEQGATLGISGATGRATGAHLHFEVSLNGNIVNPMGAGYLP